jgi:hypothetical protein
MKIRLLALIGFAFLAASLAFAESFGVGERSGAASFVRFQPSGVRGQSVLRTCYNAFPAGSICTTNPYQTTINVRSATGRDVTTIQTDAQGRFQARLRPGSYTLIPSVNVTTNAAGTVSVTFPYADPVRVLLPKGRLVPVTIIYRGAF